MKHTQLCMQQFKQFNIIENQTMNRKPKQNYKNYPAYFSSGMSCFSSIVVKRKQK